MRRPTLPDTPRAPWRALSPLACGAALTALGACAEDAPTGPRAATAPRLTTTAAAALAANGKIAFASYRDGNPEIYVMNADGSAPTRLTNDPSRDDAPTWSPDGTRIAFVSNRDGLSGIYVMRPDGSGITKVTGNAGGTIAWSPDGARIAFTCDVGGDGEICVVNVDGTGRRSVTNTPSLDLHPTWSPDGARIAFWDLGSSYPVPTDSGIFVVNVDGTGRTRLTDGLGSNRAPAWSPDGTRIAFSSSRSPAENFGIFLMNADGSGVTQLTAGSDRDEVPAWSPDGTQILFARETEDDRIGIYAIRADGSGLVRLTDGTGPDYHPAWGALLSQPQAITFTSTPPNPALVGATYAVRATGGASGNPVTFSALTPGVCAVSGGTVTPVALGTCAVAADQAGGPGYLPAPRATQSFAVVANFPRTAVLDRFARADGVLGANWAGVTGALAYRIAAQRVDVALGGPLGWHAAAFGATQEAFVTLTAIDPRGLAQGLLLKAQDPRDRAKGAIAVTYDPRNERVQVVTGRTAPPAATEYPAIAARFQNGDQLGARATAAGVVEVYKNGVRVGAVTLNAADRAFFDARGGSIGLLYLGALNALFDDFGGGTVAP